MVETGNIELRNTGNAVTKFNASSVLQEVRKQYGVRSLATSARLVLPSRDQVSLARGLAGKELELQGQVKRTAHSLCAEEKSISFSIVRPAPSLTRLRFDCCVGKEEGQKIKSPLSNPPACLVIDIKILYASRNL